MALEPGTRLGSYEITAPLGVGGMGEVYRATDPKLRRDVAIKVLPDDTIMAVLPGEDEIPPRNINVVLGFGSELERLAP
jgi:serine/threonine protein kinase